MHRRRPGAGALAVTSDATAQAPVAVPATAPTTAWQDGAFQVDPSAVVHRSDIVLGRANTDPTQPMPLGNGTWARRCGPRTDSPHSATAATPSPTASPPAGSPSQGSRP